MKRLLIILAAMGLVASIAMAIPASAKSGSGNVRVLDSEFVLCTMGSTGEIEEVQVFSFLGLNGDGTVTVKEEKSFDEVGGYQGVKSFAKPKVEGDYIVWPEISVSGNKNVLANTKLSEAMVEKAKSRIPLDVKVKYWFDGAPVTDIDTITGKSGRFKLEMTLKNTSKEKRTVEYEDPATGEMKKEEVDIYLPLVILPYDWYFDNQTFFNLECDETGIIVPMPDFYNVGWSIPLFPPATEESHTIWVAADVKDFKLPPLTLSVNFVFPHTNQANPLDLLGPAIKQVYGGVKQLNQGIGEPTREDTLLYGIAAVDGGLQKLAAGLPTAKSNLDAKLIPGVAQAAAGIGSESTENTLLWADAQTAAGLQAMAGGIGSPTSEDTLLYAMAAMGAGLNDIKAGIGSATTDETLLYAMNQMQAGLNQIKAGIGSASTPNTLLFAVAGVEAGLNQMLTGINAMIAGLGSVGTSGTILDGLDQVVTGITVMTNGLGTTATPNTIIWGLDQIQLGLANPSNPNSVYNALMGALQQFADPATSGTVRNLVDTSPTMAPAEIAALDSVMNTWAGIMNNAATGVSTMYNSLVAPLPNGIIPNLQAIKQGMDTQLLPGLAQIIAGLNNPSPPGILQGLQQLQAAIGTTGTVNTLLYAMAQINLGLQGINAGIGDPAINPSLLYAAAAVQGGLLQIAAGIGDAATGDTLLFAVQAVEDGLNQMLAGIGDAGTNPSLLYALAQMKMGMYQLKAGMASGDLNNPGVKEGLMLISAGIGDAIAGLGSSGTPDTLLYGTSQITSGLTQAGGGATQLEEGLATMVSTLNMSAAELEAIAQRGEEFDHFLGRAEDADNQVRFVYQSKPTYNYVSGSKASWIVAIVLSILAALALVAGGILLSRRSAA